MALFCVPRIDYNFNNYIKSLTFLYLTFQNQDKENSGCPPSEDTRSNIFLGSSQVLLEKKTGVSCTASLKQDPNKVKWCHLRFVNYLT